MPCASSRKTASGMRAQMKWSRLHPSAKAFSSTILRAKRGLICFYTNTAPAICLLKCVKLSGGAAAIILRCSACCRWQILLYCASIPVSLSSSIGPTVKLLSFLKIRIWSFPKGSKEPAPLFAVSFWLPQACPPSLPVTIWKTSPGSSPTPGMASCMSFWPGRNSRPMHRQITPPFPFMRNTRSGSSLICR